MNELTTDLKSLHEATLNNLKNSKANNTLRAYKSDFRDFAAFCVKHGLMRRDQDNLAQNIANACQGKPIKKIINSGKYPKWFYEEKMNTVY